MYKGNRNQVLNCRVTEETINKIDGLRWDVLKYSNQYASCSRADVIETIFKILSEDIDVSDLRNMLYYRSHYRYLKPQFFLVATER